MPRLLALEWDGQEARVAVARAQGPDVLIEHAFAVDLAPADPGETFADPNVGQRVAAVLAQRRIGRVETLAAVGRAGIELRLLTLPPAPEEELPELVRFQAQRQFATLGDDWPLDFLPIELGQSEGQSVLAAAIAPELVEQIEQTCQQAELRPRRLVLRPCAAASLLKRFDQRGAGQVRLLVDLLAYEVDLTVLVDQTVVFMRTVRLSAPLESDEHRAALLGEIRRTIAAAQNQLRGRRVRRIVICGDGPEEQRLREGLIDDKVASSVELFKPLEHFSLSDEVRRNPPQHPGRFAPLLGMLLDEAAGVPHAIDFLNPRRKPEPVDRRRTYALAAAAALCAVLAVAGWLRLRLGGLDETIGGMNVQLKSLQRTAAAQRQTIENAQQIQQWIDGDVNWLDQLHQVSLPDGFPAADAAMVEDFQAIPLTTGGGQLKLEGLAEAAETIAEMETQLRTPGRRVDGKGAQHDGDDDQYPWRFEESVLIAPPTADDSAGGGP